MLHNHFRVQQIPLSDIVGPILAHVGQAKLLAQVGQAKSLLKEVSVF